MHMASDMGIGVFVDAEETWVQEAMDALAEELMETYNKRKSSLIILFKCIGKIDWTI